MRVDMALNVFETYLSTTGTKYVASDNVTIADMALAASTVSLESCEIPFDDYPLVTTWYDTFKSENPELWEIGQAGVDAINEIYKIPPDESSDTSNAKRLNTINMIVSHLNDFEFHS